MNYEQVLMQIPSNINAPYYDGDIREVLAKHLGWLRGESWGVRANLRDANLRNANLRDANLRNANLRNADFEKANLRDANLRDADLWKANLRNANLRDADLRDADLWKANLRYANLEEAKYSYNAKSITIRKAICWDNLYEYHVMAFICTDGSVWIKMGCKFGPLQWWNKEWHNNLTEFPKGDYKTDHRKSAYDFAVNWARIECNRIPRFENGVFK